MLGQLPISSIGGGSKPSGLFARFAGATSRVTGKPLTFLLAVAIVVIWAGTGPLFHYSDTWQLVINTGTTIVTFLMVFLIQNTQNRDTVALQLKLDELLLASREAPNEVVAIEEASDEEIEQEKRKVARKARQNR
jgi:low affinity Fe/Cu permease